LIARDAIAQIDYSEEIARACFLSSENNNVFPRVFTKEEKLGATASISFAIIECLILFVSTIGFY
jgi:hypothetical protein